MSINERIRQLRKEHGLTQIEFAGKVGLKKSSASRIEQEGILISEQTIQLICEQYHVRREWLVDGSGPMYGGKETDPIMLWAEKLAAETGDSFPRRIATCFSKFSPQEWENFESILKKVIAEISAPVDEEEQKRREIEKKVEAYREKLLFEAKRGESTTSSPMPTSKNA